MKKNSKREQLKLEEEIIKVGQNLAIAASVIKCLDLSMVDDVNYNNTDIANFISVLNRTIDEAILDFSKIEKMLDL